MTPLTGKSILEKKLFDYFRPAFPSDERTNEIVKMSMATFEEKGPYFAAMREAVDAALELQRKEHVVIVRSYFSGHPHSFQFIISQIQNQKNDQFLASLFPNKEEQVKE